MMWSEEKTIGDVLKKLKDKIKKKVNIDETKYLLTYPDTLKQLPEDKKLEDLTKDYVKSTSQLLPKKLILWFRNDPKSGIKSIEFPDEDEHKWGMGLNVESHWSTWKIQSVESGKYADENGVKENDRIWSVDDNEIDESNHEKIKQKLIDGPKCLIKFKSQLKARDVTFYPGVLGFGTHDAVITEVETGGQADVNGVRPGWEIIERKPHKNGNINIRFQPKLVKIYIQKIIQFKAGPVGIARNSEKPNLVEAVQAESQASKNGIEPGWVFHKIDGNDVGNDNEKIKSALAEARKLNEYKIDFGISRQDGQFQWNREVEIPCGDGHDIWLTGKIVKLGNTRAEYKVQWTEGGKSKNKIVKINDIRKKNEKFLIEVTFQPKKNNWYIA